MAKEKKRQVCFRIEDSIVAEMENIRDKTGVPVSTQIELRLKGFTITSTKKEGTPQGILPWYESFHQDENYAKTLDQTVNRMREMKLH
jgi:antitoxin component of RelBE/YafQ-DinJ toxin-antitoxin module